MNEDGTINSPMNPAPPGSIVAIWATGEGATEPPGEDGLIAPPSLPLPIPKRGVQVRFGNYNVYPLYAGGAPSLVAGVIQINARIPEESPADPALPLSYLVGETWSPAGVTLAVGP
jgi:uncharacterized protein (TIGR03437 family)